MSSSPSPDPTAQPHLWVTILAGGIGSRFWPASTPARPKQLLPLGSENSLIADTVARARGLAPPERLRILAGSHLVEPFRRVLPDLADDSYLVEPRAVGTAPVLAWAAWEISRLDPDAVLISLHSDHVVEPPEALDALLRETAALARRENALFTVAARPSRPETGYGYIRPGQELAHDGSARAFRVGAFVEKPDAETAERYVEEGYLWNTGIFVWPARVFLEEITIHTPEIAEHLPLLESGDAEGFFDACSPCTVDVAVLERTRRICAVEATFEWDDVGNWEALARTRQSDAEGNVAVGPARIVDGTGNIVYSEDGPVVVWGTENLVVVRTAGMTLVMPRERAADLKSLMDELPENWKTKP